MVWVRSLVFNIAFYLSLAAQMIIALPVLFLPRTWGIAVVHNWAKSCLWLLKLIVGTGVEIRGRENIPAGSAIIASKHQSLWETFALIPLLTDFAFILKRELQWIPVFGWFSMKFRMIAVKRGGRSSAVSDLVAAVRDAVSQTDRHIVIFPEGTRRPIGAEPRYKTGVAALYTETGLPVVPVALNSGLFWPRRKFLRHPGTVTIEILPPIEAGLDEESFLATLEEQIETASERLVDDARACFPRVNHERHKT